MLYIIFLALHVLLLTKVNSNPINNELRLEKSPSRFGLISCTLTWRLEVNHSSLYWNKIHQEIQLAFDQWKDYGDLSFREATDGEKADIYVTFVSGNHSGGIPFDSPHGPYTVSIHFSSIETLSDSYDDTSETLRLMLTNAIISSHDDHSIVDSLGQLKQDHNQAEPLYVEDETSMDVIHRSSRTVRSTKEKKNKKKEKKNKKKKKKKQNKDKKNKKKLVTNNHKKRPNPKIITTKLQTTTVTPKPPVTFSKDVLDTIDDFIINSRSQNQLQNFSKISDMISYATGLFPTDTIPILQELAVSYAHTTRAIKISFADSCAVLSKFVVKAYNVMKGSMNENNEKVLKNFEMQLKNDALNQFNSFENTSQNQLIEIHSKLLIKAHGAKMRALLEQRREAEKEVVAKAEELKTKHSELSAIQANIASLRYQGDFLEEAMDDSKTAKKDAEAEIKRLEGQVSSYEQKLMDHRNTRTEEYGRFWIFSWRVRDVVHDNGENLARENLNRLLDRIRTLKDVVKHWSNENSMKSVAGIKHNLTRLSNESSLQQKVYAKHNESYNQAEAHFFKIINEMKAIEEIAGTVNVKSMEAVDSLARAVQSGQGSFGDAYATVRETIQTLEVDEHLMVISIQAALKFLQMGDDYMKTTRVDDIRRALGIVKPQSN